MPLSPRQEISLQDTCDLWEPTQTTDGVTGRRTAKSYTRRAQGVECHFVIRQSVEGPSALGRIEGDNMFTRDEVHFADDVTVDSDWVLVNTTLDVDGNQTKNYGRFWIVAGQPRSISKRGNREAQKRIVEAVQTEDAPNGVTL